MFITATTKAEHDPQPLLPTTQPCAPSPSQLGCPPGRIHRRCSTLVFMCFSVLLTALPAESLYSVDIGCLKYELRKMDEWY